MDLQHKRASANLLLATLLGVVLLAKGVHADKVADHRKAWTKYYSHQVTKYEIALKGVKRMPLKVDPQAKLRWGNPIRSETHGDVFIWTRKGRLELIGNIFSYPWGKDQRQVSYEFHSMSDETIEIKQKGADEVLIKGPGLKFGKIPKAPEPAKNRIGRLVQMRHMAKDFTASVKEGSEENPLRALPQPLYRYETKKVDDDGAVFAYVMGTDPELFVSIESKETPHGPKWFFAAARFSHAPLALRYKERVVWRFSDGTENDEGYLIEYIEKQPTTPKLKDKN